MRDKLRKALILTLIGPAGMFAQHTSGQTNNVSSYNSMPRSIGLSPQSIGLSPNSIGLSPSSIGTSPNALPFLQAPSATAAPHSKDRGERGDRGRYPSIGGFIGVPVYAVDGAAEGDENADAQQASDNSSEDQSVALSEQLRQLSQQVRDLQDQIAHMTIPPVEQQDSEKEQEPAAAPAITVVLKDGTIFQTQSYAVIGGMFWDLSNDPARKVAIKSIDTAASQRATSANGAEFPSLNAAR